MKNVTVNWLGDCPRCGNGVALVLTTEGCEEYLYQDDEVSCSECGHKGVVDIDESYEPPVAHAAWDEPEAVK